MFPAQPLRPRPMHNSQDAILKEMFQKINEISDNVSAIKEHLKSLEQPPPSLLPSQEHFLSPEKSGDLDELDELDSDGNPMFF